MQRPLILLATGSLVVGLGLTACGSDDDSGDGGDNLTEETDGGSGLEDVVAIDGDTADVKVLDNTFNEENISVAPGTKVVWTNDGRQDHDIIPVGDDPDAPSEFGVVPDDFASGDVYEHTFEEPGTYRYYCSLHGTEDAGMIGAVVVEEP